LATIFIKRGVMNEGKNINETAGQARKLCHDINQPLTVIMARSELILLKLAADDSNRKAVEQIHEQAEKMSDLVEQLRALIKNMQEE
jgi:signal transduction histidine kinase